MPPPSPDLVARAIRTSARVALWSSLVATLAAALSLARFSRPVPPAGYARIPTEQALFAGIDFLEFPEVRLLRDYVRIDTSHPNPDEVAGAEFLAAQLAAAGVPATIERFADRRANLWAWVEGEDPRALVLHGHLDVEPAVETEGWKFPPFAGVVEGPWIYGRGMYDMKSLTIAQLLATIDAARAGHRPRRSILFLQTSSEETGSDTGTKWILAEHPELVARMESVLTEGGVIESISPTEIKYWGIEFGQKQFARVVFCARRRAPLLRLKRLLERTGRGDPVVEIDPGVRRFLTRYGPTREAGRLTDLLVDLDRLPREPDRFAELTPFLKSLFRDEVWPLGISRAADGTWTLDVWIHALPGSDLAEVTDRLLPAWKTHGIARSPVEPRGAGLSSPLDHAVVRSLEATVAERFPTVSVGPYFLPWALTDAALFRSAGLPAYGFSPFPVVVLDTNLIARANERMQLPAYRRGIELYREAIRRLVE
jgi:acetylornithine deacetylase/succinyl-diaminopimelate desuccinylase-like protein